MDASSASPELEFLKDVRRRRAELLDSLRALEQALAAPAPGRAEHWAQRVHVSVVELSADFGEHVAITEGPDGVYGEVLTTAPQLGGAVARLTREHALIRDLVDDLLARAGDVAADEDVERVRDLGTTLLERLVRHRQRGSDLIYQAYQADFGGET